MGRIQINMLSSRCWDTMQGVQTHSFESPSFLWLHTSLILSCFKVCILENFKGQTEGKSNMWAPFSLEIPGSTFKSLSKLKFNQVYVIKIRPQGQKFYLINSISQEMLQFQFGVRQKDKIDSIKEGKNHSNPDWVSFCNRLWTHDQPTDLYSFSFLGQKARQTFWKKLNNSQRSKEVKPIHLYWDQSKDLVLI